MVITEVLKINPGKIDPGKIKKAAGIIKEGGLVAFPTEEFIPKDVWLLEIRLQLMSANGQNRVLKSTYVYKKNGQIKTEEKSIESD